MYSLSSMRLRTNLGSAIGSGRFTKQDSENIKLPLYHRSVIVGLLLSDAGLSFSNKTAVNALLRFSQSFAQYKYFWFVFFILSPFCSKYPYSRTHLRKGSINYSMELYTRTLPCFTELYHIFYIVSPLPRGGRTVRKLFRIIFMNY